MEAVLFFNRNMGRLLVPQTGDVMADAQAALSGNHALHGVNKKGAAKSSRLGAGMAIIREGHPPMVSMSLAASGFFCASITAEVLLNEIERGGEMMILQFGKSIISASNLCRTLDSRSVAIVSPAGIERFSLFEPPTATGSNMRRGMWNLRAKRDGMELESAA